MSTAVATETTQQIEQNMVAALGDAMSGGGAAASADSASLQLNEWDQEGAAFDFDEDFQDKIAALTVCDPNFIRRTRECVEPGHFENVGNALLVNLAQSYFDRYSRLPGSKAVWGQVIREAIVSKQIRANFKDEVVSALKRHVGSDVSEPEYFIDQISAFSRHQDIMAGLNECVDLASRGEFAAIERRMQKAFLKGAKGEYRESDYWDDRDKRTQTRKDKASGLIKPSGIPLGIPKLDNLLYHKGIGRREMTVLMAGAKKGKSMGLGDCALRINRQGYSVLYVTLEVSVEIITDRMDANISRTDMDDLDHRINDVDKKIESEAKKKRGHLKVVEFPSGSLTPNALQSLIERYKADGITFDALVVDYADIMAPDIYTNSETENSKQVWLGLRAIASREDVALLTATQTNREGFKSDTAKAEHAAEDFNKIRIADLVISINRTDEERARGEARLFFAASRNQSGEFTIHVKQDLAKMSFIESIIKIA